MNGKNIKSYILDFLETMQPPEGFEQLDLGSDFKEVVARVELEMNQPIIELFEKAGLDYRRSDSWLVLVGFVADVLLHKGKSGRPPKWKRPSKEVLKRDLVSCLKDDPRLKGEYIPQDMVKNFPRRYGKIPSPTILRWFAEEGISIVSERRKVRGLMKAKKIKGNTRAISA